MVIELPKQDVNNSREWSGRRRVFGAVIWASFLAACAATMLFFAQFDPNVFALEEWSWFRFDNAMAGYAIGFFFFWAIAALAAALAVFLLKSSSLLNDQSDRSTKRNSR